MKPEEVKLFSDGEEYYMFYGNNCVTCGKKLEELGVLRCMWSRTDSKIGTFCLNCFNKINNRSEIQEVKIFNVCEYMPAEAFPVIIKPPMISFGKGNETVFSAAFRDTPHTADNTRYALRESWEGSVIGNQELAKGDDEWLNIDWDNLSKEELEDLRLKEKQIIFGGSKGEKKSEKPEDINAFLLDAKDSEPLLPGSDKKRLTNG